MKGDPKDYLDGFDETSAQAREELAGAMGPDIYSKFALFFSTSNSIRKSLSMDMAETVEIFAACLAFHINSLSRTSNPGNDAHLAEGLTKMMGYITEMQPIIDRIMKSHRELRAKRKSTNI